MFLYLAILLDIKMNNNAIQDDWKKAVQFHVYKGGGRSIVGNYRPVNLTSLVCKQKEHIIAGYLKQVWHISGWLYEDQHGFRPEYSYESQVVNICEDIRDFTGPVCQDRRDNNRLFKGCLFNSTR